MKTPSKSAFFNIHGSLRDFPGIDSTSEPFRVSFELSPAVKDLIEAQNIPHTAVFKWEINGRQCKASRNVKDGDVIDVYPFELVDAEKVDPFHRSPASFAADVHLRRLTKTLRLLGIDTAWNREWDDADLVQASNREQRMILTRDVGLLKRGETRFGYWVRSQDPDRQIKEITGRFEISDNLQPFSRCMECNGLLQTVDKKEVEDKVPPKVKEWHSLFHRCRNCHKIYWQGSHFEKLKEKVQELL